MRRHLPGAGDEAAHRHATEAAAQLDAHLRAGGTLIPVPTPGYTPDPGETAYADVTCTTARFYATDLVLPPRAGYFENHPSLGRRWVTNRRLDAQRLQPAEAEAQEQWRDHEWARVLLTSDGIRINPPTSPDTWLPFDHVLLTNVTAEPDRQELVLSYSVCAPLLLTGPAVPWFTVTLGHLVSVCSPRTS
ncbi:hypothetical protein PV682_43125 [Streptomyces niveiscabiei]|uniref:hypothetical protein n=1 Tax=Streptomyces niveiscabiei TaxID=164115 RepID=UPI0029B7ACF2|nr:hypothetical protein [Streptomyces niveiscabiei]MDX3388186.1 hypothetical protein [Streptomyces niveiscabiei]